MTLFPLLLPWLEFFSNNHNSISLSIRHGGCERNRPRRSKTRNCLAKQFPLFPGAPLLTPGSCTCFGHHWHFGVSFSLNCQEEKPLEFEDIVDKRTYDKMRPPKPGGTSQKIFEGQDDCKRQWNVVKVFRLKGPAIFFLLLVTRPTCNYPKVHQSARMMPDPFFRPSDDGVLPRHGDEPGYNRWRINGNLRL